MAFEREYVDLRRKPEWLIELSPLGKVPLLLIEHDGFKRVIFESAVILEYLEETQPNPLHPDDPLERARHRSWMDFGSAILDRIARLYNAPSDDELANHTAHLTDMFARAESELMEGPWFAGERFSLVDIVFGPIFRYFDIFEQHADLNMIAGLPKIALWRRALSGRASIRSAVAPDYAARLLSFIENRKSALSARIWDLADAAETLEKAG